MTSERRVGIMGGTFDPIHHGHLVAAEEARWQFHLDQVLFIPTGQPWQKPVGVSSAEDRYLMTVIATASNPAFAVSRIEIDHPGPTYTVDTLRRLRPQLEQDTRLYFITGADAVLHILTWKNGEGILEQAELIAATRPGYDLSKLAERLPSATGCARWRSRCWPSRRPRSGRGSRAARRSSTWSRRASPTTWTSAACTGWRRMSRDSQVRGGRRDRSPWPPRAGGPAAPAVDSMQAASWLATVQMANSPRSVAVASGGRRRPIAVAKELNRCTPFSTWP
jgi:nicotinate-nucleotide adenylyltransferase